MQQLSDAMIGTLKSWLSPEPQLGLVVLVVWLPLVSVLAYIALASALSAPVIFAIFIAPYAASLFFGPILGRLNQRLRVRVERIAYLMFVACVFAWMINPRWMEWSALVLPVWLRWGGVIALLAGAALLVWTFRTLGTNLTDTVVTRQTHTLVVHGPYRWVRHPLYSSAALLVVAISLIAANWFFLAAGVALLSILIVRTRTEEQNLVLRFGDNYERYMKRTGRFVPRLII